MGDLGFREVVPVRLCESVRSVTGVHDGSRGGDEDNDAERGRATFQRRGQKRLSADYGSMKNRTRISVEWGDRRRKVCDCVAA